MADCLVIVNLDLPLLRAAIWYQSHWWQQTRPYYISHWNGNLLKFNWNKAYIGYCDGASFTGNILLQVLRRLSLFIIRVECVVTEARQIEYLSNYRLEMLHYALCKSILQRECGAGAWLCEYWVHRMKWLIIFVSYWGRVVVEETHMRDTFID